MQKHVFKTALFMLSGIFLNDLYGYNIHYSSVGNNDASTIFISPKE